MTRRFAWVRVSSATTSPSARWRPAASNAGPGLRLPNVEELGFDAHRPGRDLDLFPRRRESRATHVEQGRDPLAFGTSSRITSTRFGEISVTIGLRPVMFRPGRERLATRPWRPGRRSREDDGIVRGTLGRQHRGRPPRHDQAHLQPDELSRQLQVPFVLPSADRYSMTRFFPQRTPAPASPGESHKVGGVDLLEVRSSMPMR